MNRYDVLIIGSGLSGLSCGLMLAKEGKSVCIVERHNVIGGCLQSFNRRGYCFDTGVHYVGSLDEGQIMRQYIRYYGIEDKIELQRLDEDAFEVINISGREYRLALGRDRYVQSLINYFPQESEGILKFVDLVMKVKESISVELLREGQINRDDYSYYMSVSLNEVICSHVKDEDLRGVLAGSSLLYGGEKETSPFYVYAMVAGSNLEGAYKFIGGSQKMANAMVEKIRDYGGEIIVGNGVRHMGVDEGSISYAELDNGERIVANTYISTLHPKLTFDIVEHKLPIKKAYRTRLAELKNTFGVFTVYIGLKPNAKRYNNSYIYIHRSSDTWSSEEKVLRGDWSLLAGEQPYEDKKWTKSIELIIPIYKSQTDRWQDSHIGKRGETYEQWKSNLVEECLRRYEQRYGSIRDAIDYIETSSPLTYRDYTGTPDGTAYGVMKSCINPLPTMFSVRTKLSNLLLSGQSLYVHGIIGVTMTATLTCAELLGNEYLAKRITEV